MSDRRLEIATAAWRVIIREGLDRASLRAIAQELGTTVGVITHHFRSKDELMAFALDATGAKLLEPITESSSQAEGTERLMQMLWMMLPVNVNLEEVWQVWFAFLSYAVGRDALMQDYRRCATQLKDAIAREIQALKADELVPRSIDPDLEARNLLAFVQGLAMDAIAAIEPLSPQDYLELLHRQIQKLGV